MDPTSSIPRSSAALKRRSAATIISVPLDPSDSAHSPESTLDTIGSAVTPSSSSRDSTVNPRNFFISPETSPLMPHSLDVPRLQSASRKKLPGSSTMSSPLQRRWRRFRTVTSLLCKLVVAGLVVGLLGLSFYVMQTSSMGPGGSATPTRKVATVRPGKKAAVTTEVPAPPRRGGKKGHAPTTEEPTTTEAVATTTPKPTPTPTPRPTTAAPVATAVATTSVPATTTTAAPVARPKRSRGNGFSTSRRRWGVLVQHDDAATRLGITVLSCAGKRRCHTYYMKPRQLPSWTLHHINESCGDCVDTHVYGSTVNDTDLVPKHAVYASVRGPLGRVGPMLYAMSSVTDDVEIEKEVPEWTWLRFVHPSLAKLFSAVTEEPRAAAGTATGPLAVMGIPSTDQPVRVALRTAQRRTWLSYSEVARSENGFEGALLPLYLFAATEPDATTAERLLQFIPRALTPSHAAFKVASAALATGASAENEAEAYEERRVELRPNWSTEAVSTSPCGRAVSRTVAGGVKSTALYYLSDVLALPVTPAAVAPAQFICHASAALWQEALAHRNMVWIDMMTDRKPTTKKKLGDITKWGLPVEVGMSQKLILWLEYAYHAFPNVPFIVKGDDDSYLKVPQFLRDIRYVSSGAHYGPEGLRQLLEVNATPAMTAAPTVDEEELESSASTTAGGILPECVYWGSMRDFQGVMFNAGMTFMAHRKLVKSVLGPAKNMTDSIDIVNMAVAEFNMSQKVQYRLARLHQEDILLGLRIFAAKKHAKAVCAGGRVWYVNEGLGRFHDMHRGKLHNVTWATVVAHRCTPADTYLLHYYFQKEYQYHTQAARSSSSASPTIPAEAAATADVMEWVAQQVSSPEPGVWGWNDLPAMQYTHDADHNTTFTVSEEDKVAVYDNPYIFWEEPVSNVTYGLVSIPRE